MEEKSKIDRIEEKLDKLMNEHEDQSKEWKLPARTRFGMGKRKKRKGYVVFMDIARNKAVTFVKAPIEDGVALVHNIPVIVEPEDILLWKNRLPMVIRPSWSERPFSPKDHFAKTEAAGQGTIGWEYIMNYIYKTQIKAKKAIGAGLWIIGALVAGGLAWYFFRGGSGTS